MSQERATDAAQLAALTELRELIDRAKQGDRQVVPRLREYLDAHPVLWEGLGNIALQAQAAWIGVIAGQNLHLRECLARKVNQLKQELAGPSPTPMEALLVERVVTSWLRLELCEAQDAQQDERRVAFDRRAALVAVNAPAPARLEPSIHLTILICSSMCPADEALDWRTEIVR